MRAVSAKLFTVDGSHSPNNIANIVGSQQGTAFIQRYADRPAIRIAIFAQKIGKHVNRLSDWLAIFKGNKNNFITTMRLAIPGTVLTYKHAVGKRFGQLGARRGGQTQ